MTNPEPVDLERLQSQINRAISLEAVVVIIDIPRAETILAELTEGRKDAARIVLAAVANDFTDEQAARGIKALNMIRRELGEKASDETICGAVYDAMLYPIRQLFGWKNTDAAIAADQKKP